MHVQETYFQMEKFLFTLLRDIVEIQIIFVLLVER